MNLGKIEVSGIDARTVYRKTIPKGIVGATVEIEYKDPRWDSLTKTVVFWGCCVKDVLNPGTVVEIPAEVAEAAGYRLRVGVYGVDAENNLVIPTLWADLGYIEYSADPSGDETTDPQLPVWAQMEDEIVGLKKQIGDLNELETEDKSSLVAAINEVRKTSESSSDSSQNGDGLTSTEKNLILSLFKNTTYIADMSATIAQLETLWSGGTVEPDEPVTPDVAVSQTGSVLTIGGVSDITTVAQSGTVLTMA